MKYSTIIKKIAALSLSAVLAVGALTACSGSDTANEDNERQGDYRRIQRQGALRICR